MTASNCCSWDQRAKVRSKAGDQNSPSVNERPLEAEIPARNKTITEVRVYDTDGSQGIHYPQGWEVYSSATSGSLGSLKATVGYMGTTFSGDGWVSRPVDSYRATSSEFTSEQFLNIKFGSSQNNHSPSVYIGKIEILFK